MVEEQPVSRAVRTHTFIHEVHCLTWVQFLAPQNNYNSNTKDHGPQITITNKITMKRSEIFRELPKYDTET